MFLPAVTFLCSLQSTANSKCKYVSSPLTFVGVSLLYLSLPEEAVLYRFMESRHKVGLHTLCNMIAYDDNFDCLSDQCYKRIITGRSADFCGSAFIKPQQSAVPPQGKLWLIIYVVLLTSHSNKWLSM